MLDDWSQRAGSVVDDMLQFFILAVDITDDMHNNLWEVFGQRPDAITQR